MRIPNTFAAQTPIGAAISNFGSALFSGPTPAEQEKLAADMAYRDALTKEALASTTLKQTEQGGYTDFAQLMAQLAVPQELPRADPAAVGPMSAMSREQQLSGALPDLATAATMIDPAQASELVRMVLANLGGTDDQTVRAMAGAGDALGVNDAVSLGGQQNVAERNFGYDTSLNEADNASAVYRQMLADAAALDRQNRLPVGTSAGETTTFYPDDARAPGGTVVGLPTLATQQGAAFADLPADVQALAVGPSETEVNARTILGLSPDDQRIAAIGRESAGAQPLAVGGNELTDAWTGIAGLFDGGLTTEGGKTVISEDFWQAVAASGKRQEVEEAMSSEYQRTRDVAQAQRAGLAALGIATDTTIEGTGWMDGDPRFSTPEAAPAAPAPVMAQPPAQPGTITEGQTVIQNGWIYRMQNGQMTPVGPVS